MSDAAWKAKAQELVKVVEEMGHFPKYNEEMGSWLNNQRQAYKGHGNSKWTIGRQKYMDAHLPGWNSIYVEEKWQNKVQDLIKVVEKLGHFPTQQEEMGNFLSNQREAFKGHGTYKWTPEREAYLDEHLPGWLNKSYDEIWLEKVQKLAKVTEKLSRFPKAREEMGVFLQIQRQAYKGQIKSRWTPEREAYLDKHLSGWRSNNLEEEWQEKVFQLVEITKKLGRLPKINEEMGTWLNTQRQTAKGKRASKWVPERGAFMDEHLPGWKGVDLEEVWLENAQKLEAIHKKLGRLPKQLEEMGYWLSIQRQAAKGKGTGKWTSEREDYLNEHLPGWKG